MTTNSKALEEFYELFGKAKMRKLPGNVGRGRNIASVCNNLIHINAPVLLDYFESWNKLNPNPYECEQYLIKLGQWEGAWALAQLHYNQLLKSEAKKGKRLHKGHPLCNLALVGQSIESRSLAKHYALLSSAGDLYWEHKEPPLRHGGLAPVMLERFESRKRHYLWRDEVRAFLKTSNKIKPLYLESLLAMRWFSKKRGSHLWTLAYVKNTGSTKTFVEVLLDLVKTNKGSTTKRGTLFEAAAGLLISATPGFDVIDSSEWTTTDEQVDLVVYYSPEFLGPLGLEKGPGLVECKSQKNSVSSKDLRDFGAKCLFHRAKFGILVARKGITGGKDGQNAELVRRRFQADGLTLLTLNMNQLRNNDGTLRGVAEELSADYKKLVYGGRDA